jgi:cytochrome c peroxidase
MMKKVLALALACLLTMLCASVAFAGMTKEEELGQLLYFDRYLSLNQNQSCASCHDPNAGWADPLNLRLPSEWQFSAGSDTTLMGGRNAPPAGYALFSPPFFGDGAPDGAGFYTGGQFWDGRAPTLKDQAMGPFLNPVEMAMPDKAAVIAAMIDPANRNAADYLELFDKAYKIDLTAVPLADPLAVDQVYALVGQAIGEFEKTAIFAPFSSKWDEVQTGKATFTPEEAAGEVVFNGIGLCSSCHLAPLFTDFTYDNLGIPQLVPGDVDLGLGAGDNLLVLPADLPLQAGKFKVSSLRNIEMTPPYGHNGYFATLSDIVHFYNTRDVLSWPQPEVPQNVNHAELGDLGLTLVDEANLVAFLKTLTDR